MVSGWKRKIIKVLLLLHLFLLVGGIVLWGKGYVSLAHHRHQGVLYEITALLAPYHWHGHWQRESLFPLEEGGLLRVSVQDSEDPFFSDHLLFVWGETLEENLRLLQPPEAISSLVWVEGVKRSGNEEPTLIAWGTAELAGEWWFTRQTKSKYGIPRSEFPTTHREAAIFSQRIYNLDRLWLVFYSFRDSQGKQLEPGHRTRIMHNYRRRADLPRLGSPSELVEGKRPTATDILERIRPYQPGAMPIGYRLRVLNALPAESDILWLLPHPRGEWETLFLMIGLGLALATTPHRILFYLPLMLAPRMLVWPVAVLWALLLLGSGLYAVRYYRLLK